MRATGPGQSVRLLLDIASIVIAENIEYAAVGAVAASIHGVVRASLDADAVLSATIPQSRMLDEKLKALGFQVQFKVGDFDDPIPALTTISDSHGNRVDLLAGLRGLEPEAFSRTIDVPFQDGVLRVIGREDFVAMKLFAGGPLDLEDARCALAVAQGSLDMPLLQRLTQRYGAAAVESLNNLLK